MFLVLSGISINAIVFFLKERNNVQANLKGLAESKPIKMFEKYILLIK